MTEHFDYVFIGSGVAGATVAKRLLEHERSTSILMLDAGPEVRAKDRRYWWDYIIFDRKPYDYTYDIPGENTTRGDIQWGYDGARVMAYGGSTLHWGAWCLRYKPEDFRLRANTGEGADWPISYEDLDGYYYEAEQYLSVCGDCGESWNHHRADQPYPRPFFEWTAADGVMIEAMQKVGIEPGKMPIARYRKCMTTGTCKYCPFGSRFTAQYVLDDLRADPRHVNFEQRCQSPVMRIVPSTKRRIGAIEYLDLRSGDVRRVHADTFIVCSGTLESAKLLMRSVDSNWERGIGNDHDLVGRHIVSHSFLRVMGSTPSNPEHWIQEYDFPTLMSRTYDTEEYQKDGKIFLFKNRVLPNIDIAQLMIDGNSRQQVRDVLAGPMQMELQAFYEEHGLYHNRLVPKAGTNRLGLPLSEIQYLRSPGFAERATNRLGLMRKVIEAMDFDVQYAKWDDPGGHHATSTCRMGETPADGVTDRDMKVFGTDNLYVCSNAAFPTCTAVNPTLTLTAMSMRLGDHLISEATGTTVAAPVPADIAVATS
jgi:choline dehydrogenase-like flavoprotein